MTVEHPLPTATGQQWPCGPECHHAQPMTGTYGEWLWCNQPQIGGRVVREGHDCPRFQAALSTEPISPLPYHRA